MIRNPKQHILISFSGGETSAFMINWMLLNMPEHKFTIVFANTGEENEQTLEFVEKCSKYFNVNIVWVEYERLGFKIVDFKTAYRSHNPEEIKNGWKNHPFRKYISFFGIPNMQNMSCTRELKEQIINRYMAANGFKPSTYDKAIGIRADELGRVGKFFYPLLKINATKKMINAFWAKMPFRLELKGWEGNCKVCWKKSIRKLITIARYYPERFAFFKIIEDEFGNFVKDTHKTDKRVFPIRFFRGNKSVNDIFEMAKDLTIEDAKDDSIETDYQMTIYHDGTELDVVNGCVESCNAFN